MLQKQIKGKIIAGAATHEGDTGSPEVQISLFTEEIERLAKHLKKHVKDVSSRRGLLKIVAKRKRMLDYLKRNDPARHIKVARALGLRA